MRLQTATMMLLWFPPLLLPEPLSLSLFPFWELVAHESEGVSSDLLFTLIFLMVGLGWINFDLKEDIFFFGYHPLKGRLKLNYTKAVIISIYHVGNETGRSAFTTIVFLRKKHDKNFGHHTVTVVSWGGKTKGKQGHFVGCNGKVQEKVLKWLFQ